MLRTAAWGIGAWVAAVGGAMVVQVLDTDGDGIPRYDTLMVALLLLSMVPTFIGAWTVWRGGDNRNLAIGLGAGAVWVASSLALYRLYFLTTFPADFLSPSEANFVANVIKLRTEGPLYGPPAAFDSYVYAPGAPTFTYGLAWILGGSTSIPILRSIQVLYALISAAIATVCCVLLIRKVAPDVAWRLRSAWGLVLFPFFFLIATNPDFNRYSTLLSVDGLGQVIFVLGYFVLVAYIMHGHRWLVIAMVFIPAVGFLVEQHQLLWLGAFALFLALFDTPRSVTRGLFVGAGGLIATATVALICLWIWGEPFRYWVLGVLEHHEPPSAWNAAHLTHSATVLVLVVIGGAMWWRGSRERPLWGAWVFVMGALVVSSLAGDQEVGLNHLGPTALVGSIWFMASVISFYERSGRALWSVPLLAVAVIAALLFTGSIPHPQNEPSTDATTYVQKIETEMEGLDPTRVLIDVGAFVHLRENKVWRDGALSVAEATQREADSLAGLKKRIRKAYYKKVLVREGGASTPTEMNRGRFGPDILKAVRKRYRLKGKIPAAGTSVSFRTPAFDEVSVYVPRKPRPKPPARKTPARKPTRR